MTQPVTKEQLIAQGLPATAAETLISSLNTILTTLTPELAWQKISKELLTPQQPFTLHEFLFTWLFPTWQTQPENAPLWLPTQEFIPTTNLARHLAPQQSVADFHAWSVTQVEAFWQLVINALKIIFTEPPTSMCDLSAGVENPQWFAQGKLNIVESCFNHDKNAVALIFLDAKNSLQKISYGELEKTVNRIANSLIAEDFKGGDAIAICMPMTIHAIAIYLAIIKMGGVVVSIADSFASEEIALRLQIANTKAVFTQDCILRSGKTLPLYSKITAASAPKIIVLSAAENRQEKLRAEDLLWQDFLKTDSDFKAVAVAPMTACNILFSSGTTGTPKAIPWNHATAIKAASDAYFHQNIQAGDVLAWPTNLGWMMGPWLIFAALINKASIAVYADAPQERGFAEFIQHANVTMLGVVPMLVAHWRQNHTLENLNFSHLKVFTSTGECSNSMDMLYLSSRARYQPIIEYCGGTEIGGSYLSSTVLQNNCPATFSTPVMGIQFLLIDEKGKPTDCGEVAIIPPALGLSVTLLNANHHEVYFANMPSITNKILRRHGDEVQRLTHGYYRVLGRVDDTMNLGGIKISAAEIERCLVGIEHITETAAVGIHTPAQLIIYAVASQPLNSQATQQIMQKRINQHLNPLFKIQRVIFLEALPKTASNKILRRVLRDLPLP